MSLAGQAVRDMKTPVNLDADFRVHEVDSVVLRYNTLGFIRCAQGYPREAFAAPGVRVRGYLRLLHCGAAFFDEGTKELVGGGGTEVLHEYSSSWGRTGAWAPGVVDLRRERRIVAVGSFAGHVGPASG